MTDAVELPKRWQRALSTLAARVSWPVPPRDGPGRDVELQRGGQGRRWGTVHAAAHRVDHLLHLIARSWRQLLQTFGAAGMLISRAEPAGDAKIPALDAVAAIKDCIYARAQAAFPEGHRFDRFLSGQLTGRIRRWLIENYRYTRSATYHISPVLDHVHTEFQRGVWQRFLADESSHWKIYRPAFSELGIEMSEVDQSRIDPGTKHFVDTLRGISAHSSIGYAAAMMFIEEPPLTDAMKDDQLGVALMRHHGLSYKAVRPLCWHATENRTAGHSALGPIVLSHRGALSDQELGTALEAVTKTIDAVSYWQHSILGTPDGEVAAGRATGCEMKTK